MLQDGKHEIGFSELKTQSVSLMCVEHLLFYT